MNALMKWMVGLCMLLCVAVANADVELNGAPLEVKPHDAFAAFPLRLELECSMSEAGTFQILAASQAKSNPWHWELFTSPNDNHLNVYVPGFKPDHARFGVSIADEKWHTVVLEMELAKFRLYIDGKLVGERVMAQSPAAPPKVTQPFYFGKIDGLGFTGKMRRARLSYGVTWQALPDWRGDGATIAYWDMEKGATNGVVADSSGHGHDARVIQGNRIASVKLFAVTPTDSMRLKTRDATSWRKMTSDWLAKHRLKADDFPRLAERDHVWDVWQFNLENFGKVDYAALRHFRADFRPAEEQVYDTQSLTRPEDKNAAGSVLRQTHVLLDDLHRKYPEQARLWMNLEGRWKALDAAWRSDLEFDAGAYFTACALRREVMFANPLLSEVGDFLCVSRGVFEGSVRSIPFTNDAIGGHFATQYFGHNTIPGGGIFRVHGWREGKPLMENILANSVVENGRFKGRKLDFGAFCTPDLSYDGKRLAFAWTCNNAHTPNVFSRNNCWHIFTVNIDGTNLRMLTDGAWDDFDPCWLPNGRIAFVSERRGGYIRCFAASLKVRNHTLFSMKDDGTDIVPMSYFETSEWNPSVNNDGMLVYARWDYTDRENCLGGRFWIANPDGTNPRAPHGNYPYPWHTLDVSNRQDFKERFPTVGYSGWGSRIGTPLVQMGIRAIPNSQKYIFVAAPHHGQAYGSLGMLDLSIDDDGRHSQIRRITPYEPYPETELSNRLHYKYGMPWPLSEDCYLANAWENIVVLDRFGNEELLCDLRDWQAEPDERFRLVDPIPLRPRKMPPVIPTRTWQGERATENAPKATIAVMNVYDSDQPFPKDVKIKWLRVVQNILKTNHAMGVPMIGNERENTPRIPLGIVPVEEDGSVFFEAPVAKELIFQALDENRDAVQSMRSVAFVFPGEQLNCLGCHEPRQQAPKTLRVPLAMRRAPSKLEPEMTPIEPISFERHIRPILERTCKDCGHEWFKNGKLDYAALREQTFWFSGGMLTQMVGDYCGIHGGSRSIPGRFGARVSPLAAQLDDAAHCAKLTDAERHLIHLWLDCNSLRIGAFREEERQWRGELVWPSLDVDSRNPQGLERLEPKLKRNFWHENHYGPYVFVGSSHQRNEIFIMDEAGKITWSYPAVHPQDVWRLDNGNILFAWQHGAREVTMDKQVVWEYTVVAPNEVPSVQPLPNGNVLVGIVGECRLVEVDRQGREVKSIPLRTSVVEPHAQFRMCRKTPQGTYLVPFSAEGALREVDENGNIVHEFPKLSFPVCAVRLPDEHTLVTASGRVMEYAADGKRVVWEMRPQVELVDIDLAIPAGVQRLPNGNTLVCNWGASGRGGRQAVHIFEVTHDGCVVWMCESKEIGQVVQCQILGEEGAGVWK